MHNWTNVLTVDRLPFETPAVGLPGRPRCFSASAWVRLIPAGLVTLGLAIGLVLAESLGATPPAALVLELEATAPGTWVVLSQGRPLTGIVDAQGRWRGAVPDGATLEVTLLGAELATAPLPSASPIPARAVAMHWTFTQGAASRDGMVWGGQAELLAKAHEGDHD